MFIFLLDFATYSPYFVELVIDSLDAGEEGLSR